MSGVMPPYVQHYVESIRKLQGLPNATSSDQGKLNTLRLKLACWLCRSEGLDPTPDNLRSVLGPHASEAMTKLQQVAKEMGPSGPILSYGKSSAKR